MVTASLLLVALLAGQNILCSGFSVGQSTSATSVLSSRLSCRLCMSSKTSASWEKLTVTELKSQLKEWKLPVSGTKAELIRRLTEYETSLYTDSQSDLDPPQETINSNKKTLFPPPKDESEIRSMEKEVSETIRMLETLKLSGAKLSQQQKQQKKFVEKMISEGIIDTPSLPRNLSAEQMARAELLQHHTEELRKRPANALKGELTSLRLPTKGRKPDLVSRLAEYYVTQEMGEGEEQPDLAPDIILPMTNSKSEVGSVSFAGIPRLSNAAANALCQAFGSGDNSTYPEPTPIQSVAIPKLFYPPNPSAILHAPTGSGKTLTFLLPVTEHLWREVNDGKVDPNDLENGMALILLPTRELAAQVAGVATVLAPPGMVRFIPHPMDLMKKGEIDAGADFAYYEEHGEEAHEGNNSGTKYSPRILVGSAKSLSISLFGDGKMPGTPTRKPDGKRLLGSVRWLVMDEVDRLLNVKKTRTDKTSRHEKPAALLAAAVARLTMGRAQVIAASATVGRPLRRELSRVLGLHSSECPETLRSEVDSSRLEAKMQSSCDKHIGRAVMIPDTVTNYFLPIGNPTSGSLLTAAAMASKSMMRSDGLEESSKKVLVVLTRNCGIKVHDALGALRHFGIRPEPQSLLDALEADGSDRLMEAHRRVSGVVGVGGSRQSINDEGKGYLLITHEDNVRGLHLDSLDAVVVVGRPGSPDEYTHIAGRTGRAGRRGCVLNIVSYEQASGLASWNKMLGVDFYPLDKSEIANILTSDVNL